MTEVAAPRSPSRGRGANRAIGIVLAGLAAGWHALLMTRATNDNFLHMTLAQQWLHGDWPVRDFFDEGWVLQYSLTAAGHLLFGERLAAEAVIVAAAWAISTYLVFVVVRRLTGSVFVAAASALLLVLAGARGYSYPKGIVYAVAAAIWWRYVEKPSMRRAALFGVWAAVAFYWRPDHGIYVAVAIALAMLAAHGVTLRTVSRGLVAAAGMLACLAPFLLYVQLVYGLPAYVQTGLVQAQVEHDTQGPHAWPLLRYASTLVAIEPASRFAPIVGIRWRSDSSPEQRQAVRDRYGLTSAGGDDGVEQVRLSATALDRLRALINHPMVDDTAGIDRSAGALEAATWPTWNRWRFRYPFLRLAVLPELDDQARATEWTAAAFFLFPLLLLIAAPWVSRRLDGPGAGVFAAFAIFSLVVAWAMIRSPFQARVADAVVLSSVSFGLIVGAFWRTRTGRRGVVVTLRRLLVAGLTLAVAVTVARAGRFDNPRDWPEHARAAYRELSASPPLAFYIDRPARFTLRLAAYARDCVPADDRLLVLWFEPEIYYYSDRLMAQRHAVFAPAWAALEGEQRATLEKVTRAAPPIVLARRSALDEYARATYPGVIAYVTANYQLASTARESGEEYLIYARRDRPILRQFATEGWPCYTARPSIWARAGRPGR